jgi:non-heme chloroperoxidase
MRSRMLPRALYALAVAAATWLGAPDVANAQPRNYAAKAPDGVTLAVREAGNPEGPAIILVHGLLGSHLSWSEQIQAAHLQKYRLITYDLRGHGQSDKPADAAAYADGRRWAGDLAAVIQASNARQPVLVGWSLGAAVITNYLAAHGDGAIAGAVYAGGVIELEPGQITAHPEVYRDMNSQDLKTHLDGERAFLELCFHAKPDATTFQRLLANAAMASWDMQRAVPSMTIAAAEGLGRMRKPLLQIHGARDALVQAQPSIERARQLNPKIRVKIYEEVGHAPFLEEPARFNRDLADFVEAAAPR